MGILPNHVPSIEQLKPGLVEIFEESGGNKRYFRMSPSLEDEVAWRSKNLGLRLMLAV